MSNPLSKVREIRFSVIADRRGNLTPIEGGKDIPFDIARIYYLYDVPSGAERAGHAHRRLHQIFLSMSGSFDIHMDDGHEQRDVHMNRSWIGLYVPPMVWRTVDNFSGGSVLMVLASLAYDESEYIRDYDVFLREARVGGTVFRDGGLR